ncbi:MAG: hypothetical protein MRZ79_27015 [Bacteroidia bacterium]|nr:hypothetical protein [Bacteroidia bacterium]
MNNISTQSISIKRDYESAFNYISDPLNQKEWAINFIQEIRSTEEGLFALTPFGETPIRMKSDIDTGLIDILMGDGKNPTPTRLIKNGEGCEYIFSLRKPVNMPEQIWQAEGIPGLIEELETLKSILENKLP